MSPLPVVGNRYTYFDDGKIRSSSKYLAFINDIVPFENVDQPTMDMWKQEVSKCDWLYAPETDYFIKATLQTSLFWRNVSDIIFVRTIHGEWFSLGFWAGVLDVDGSLETKLENGKN